MITDALLSFGLIVFNFFWGLLPEWTWTMPPPVGSLITLARSLDWIAPVTEFGQVLGLSCALFAALWGWKLVKQLIDWVMAIIP